MSYKNLHSAKIKKDDEFYTLYEDIDKQLKDFDISKYNKILLPCDSKKSNFYIYLKNRIELEKLKNTKLYLEEEDFNLKDFKDYDLILTNPPFSKAREFMKKVLESKKDFLTILPLNFIEREMMFKNLKDNNINILNGVSKFLRENRKIKKTPTYFFSNIKKFKIELWTLKLDSIINYEKCDGDNYHNLNRTTDITNFLKNKYFYLPISSLTKKFNINLKFIKTSKKVKVNGKQKYARILCYWDYGDESDA